ncbi:hypothetical protein Mnod_0739 [Methylobacterium nodulans ORS 2060]|uniref:Uncharacterized protein n=1 Tax=Methylobacterium nodulans (strain LMG 21967 / CNCM I-2342 / ORS 2060) TaxID=460265 RepID=B8IF60_METNO|nr:hypothetical protein Mnod_0739 [Methylobacterium nodulans ORS 2060]
MNQIEVEEGLRLCFPGRCAEFGEGVAIGYLLARLASGAPHFTRRIAPETLVQAQDVAERFGYRARVVAESAEGCEVAFVRPAQRPVLRVVGEECEERLTPASSADGAPAGPAANSTTPIPARSRGRTPVSVIGKPPWLREGGSAPPSPRGRGTCPSARPRFTNGRRPPRPAPSPRPSRPPCHPRGARASRTGRGS